MASTCARARQTPDHVRTARGQCSGCLALQGAGWTVAAAAVACLRAACCKGRLVDGHIWEVDALHAGVAKAVDRKEAHALVEAGRQQQLPIGVELHAAHDCLGRVGLHSKEWPTASASASRRRAGRRSEAWGRWAGPLRHLVGVCQARRLQLPGGQPRPLGEQATRAGQQRISVPAAKSAVARVPLAAPRARRCLVAPAAGKPGRRRPRLTHHRRWRLAAVRPFCRAWPTPSSG